MRRIHLFALLAILALVIVAGVKLDLFSPLRPAPPEDGGPLEPGEEPAVERDIRTITLKAVGGLYPHLAILDENHLGGGEYDFWPAFEHLAPHIQDADIAMLTLETMQAGPDLKFWGVSGYTGHTKGGILTFNAPIELSKALKRAGFNLYVLANNHCLDRGVEGLHATLNNVRELGFYTTGAYLNPEEREAVDMVEINGIKVAFVAYTYWTNGIPVPAGEEYAVNLIPNSPDPEFKDISPIIADIKRARAAGADLVAVVPHWGEQYVDAPFERQREAAREMAEAGADMIIGGHPKLVQPCEWIEVRGEDGETRSVPVIYSLGNFYTDQHYPSTPTDLVEFGMLLTLELSKDMDSGKAWVSGVDYDIHWCYRNWRHRMLLLSEVFAEGPEKFNLSQSQLEWLKDKYRQNIEIIERYGFSER
ncbi:MAG: CapA family protein [Firmicutes bacterium]|nr:CapA family protein [Bacillota bacterium]HPU01656.1 CapA family protein [Bacillota bacterium]